MMIWLRRLLITALILYVALCAIMFIGQRKFIYFPPATYHTPPNNMSEVKTPTGHLGWYSPSQTDQPTVMVFHGNASSIDSNLHIFRDLQAAGYGVWSVGYPGYPGNDGKPTQETLVQAAREQYETLIDMGVTDIVFYGTSLGSGVASQLSAIYQPELLIIDAPFNSVYDMARQNMPIIPTGLLLKDKWDSTRALQGLDVPMIWIHGTADNIISMSHGQKLFDGYAGPKTPYLIQGAHHTNTWLKGGREIVLEALKTE